MLPRFEARRRCSGYTHKGDIAARRADHVSGAARQCRTRKDRFRILRACISGGAPLPAELKARFEERSGSVVIEGYGLTESSGVISCNPYEGTNKTGSIGQPIPGTQVRLVDKEIRTRMCRLASPANWLPRGRK